MFLFGVLGLGFEVVFTSILDSKSQNRRFLMGYSSLWYAPLYAITPLFLSLFGHWLFTLPFFIRGLLYALIIWFFEYLGMWALRLLLGASPSEHIYYKSPWNVHGLIRLDYFPAMFILGLALELVFREIQ